jgi:hypothetical protein
MIVKSMIRAAPGGDGPFFVVTEKEGVVTNVTLTLASLAAALDQAKTDQAAAISGLTWQQTSIGTTAV